MIVINELRITPDGKCLIVDASIENLSYYRDMYISAVHIEVHDNFIETGPSEKAIKFDASHEIHGSVFKKDHKVVTAIDGCQPIQTEDSNCKCGNIFTSEEYGKKHIRLVLKSSDFNDNKWSLDNNLFFVYITASGTPSPGTPCGMDESTVMGVVYNLRPWYNYGMGFIRGLADTCDIPAGFIDYILRFKAFQLALKTGHYPVAIKYWKWFIKGKKPVVKTSKGCGCNGTL